MFDNFLNGHTGDNDGEDDGNNEIGYGDDSLHTKGTKKNLSNWTSQRVTSPSLKSSLKLVKYHFVNLSPGAPIPPPFLCMLTMQLKITQSL